MCRTIRCLRDSGFEVFTVDRDPNSPGYKYSSGFAVINITDVQGIVNYAKEINADLILPVNDWGVLPAAIASQELKLPGLPVEVAKQCVNKGLMRACWEHAGIAQPSFHVCRAVAQAREAAGSIGYPVVLKPTESCGSRGVTVARTVDDVENSFEFALAHSTTGEVIVEGQMVGTEFSIEGVVREGEPIILTRADKRLQADGRYCVTMELNYPAEMSASDQQLLDEAVTRCVQALGIHCGVFHAEFIQQDDQFLPLEIAARGGGGHIFGEIVEQATGIPMPAVVAKLLLSLPVDISSTKQKAVCYRFFAIQHLASGVDALVAEATRMSGIVDIGYDSKTQFGGDPIRSGADRPGFVVSVGDSRGQAYDQASSAIDLISTGEVATDAI
ncbi:ATP-grasp domain-containing protein [Bremerella sp. JC770]|uniref:ATP-grasp domain-containing protein n=1 Tax=Bremerella sp. JC770 TaxID=3232137 RepID=UPI00345A014D